MGRPKRRNGRHKGLKRALLQEQFDLILATKDSKFRRPITHFDGDGEQSLPVIESTHRPVNWPALYVWKAGSDRPVKVPCRLLMLPAELRVMIFRYVLRCDYPIISNANQLLQVDKRDKVTIELLRTCRQINDEGSEIFFGENTVNLLRERTLSDIKRAFAPRNIGWLTELRIEIPFVECQICVDPFAVNDVARVAKGRRIIGAARHPIQESLFNKLIKRHLDAVYDASRLKRLVMIIEPNWPFSTRWRKYLDGINWMEGRPFPKDYIPCFLDGPDVWEELVALFRHRPDIEVTVVRLFEKDCPQYNKEEHERIIQKLRSRLGIWDVRETQVTVDRRKRNWSWSMPPANLTEDPTSDMLESVQTMFEQAA